MRIDKERQDLMKTIKTLSPSRRENIESFIKGLFAQKELLLKKGRKGRPLLAVKNNDE
jgi:hypothetical protein